MDFTRLQNLYQICLFISQRISSSSGDRSQYKDRQYQGMIYGLLNVDTVKAYAKP